jgi:hypothetical protein
MIETARVGAIAALIAAATYIFGFVVLGAVLAPAGVGAEGATPLAEFTALVQNATLFQVWNFVIYVLNGVVLVALVVALHAMLREPGSTLIAIASAFGLIWSGLVIASGMVASVGFKAALDGFPVDAEAAAGLWSTVAAVRNGLGGGNEIVGGLWVMLLSLAALRAARLSRPLNVLGLVAGASGVASAIPVLGEIGGAIFGLGMIVWFAWCGLVLWRQPASGAA